MPLFFIFFLFISSLSYGRASTTNIYIERRGTDTRITLHRLRQASLYVAFNEIAFNMQYTIMLTAHPPGGFIRSSCSQKAILSASLCYRWYTRPRARARASVLRSSAVAKILLHRSSACKWTARHGKSGKKGGASFDRLRGPDTRY